MAAGIRGDIYHFDVRSNRPENSGTESTGLISPKLGVVFAPRHRLELYGNVGLRLSQQRCPRSDDHIDPATGNAADKVTPLVRTRGGEFGVRSILIPKLQTTVAVWGLTLDSELVFVGDAGTTEAGRPSRRFGVEWTNYYSPRPWLTLDADLSWSSARFTDGDPVGPQIPGAVGRVASAGVSVSRSLPVSRDSYACAISARGRSSKTGACKRRRSALFNAEVRYRVAAGTRLVLDVLNLFDAKASDIEYYYASRLPGEPAGRSSRHPHASGGAANPSAQPSRGVLSRANQHQTPTYLVTGSPTTCLRHRRRHEDATTRRRDARIGTQRPCRAPACGSLRPA